MNSRTWIILLVVLLISSNAFWLYRGIDFGISYTYLEASLDDASRRAEQATRLANLNLIGLSADEVQMRIESAVSGAELFEKDGCLIADGICLKLDDDRVVVGIE